MADRLKPGAASDHVQNVDTHLRECVHVGLMKAEIPMPQTQQSLNHPSQSQRPSPATDDSPRTGWLQATRDFLSLTKPRIVLLILLTTWVGFLMGSALTPAVSLLSDVLIGVGLLCAGSAALNQVIERDRDALMARTRKRAIAAKRLSPMAGTIFGLLLSIVGTVWLLVFVNWLTALVGVVTSLTYLVIYTPMKLTTTWSIFFGAIAGSLPPVMGWTGAQNSIGWGACALFGIMMVWQVPHSFAIALLYGDDYAHADFAVARLAKRDSHSLARLIQLYSTLMLLLASAPWLLRLNTHLYLIGAAGLGVLFIIVGMPFGLTEPRSYARRVFRASLVYLPLLFIWMALTRIGI